MPRWKKHILVWAIFLVLMSLMICFWGWPHLSEPLPSHRSARTQLPPPSLILVGPAIFTLLALIIAFAVYLRQVSSRALEMITKIHANEEKLYPKGFDHTDMKLKSLLRTRDNLDITARFMIALIIVIALRIIVEVLARFPNPPDWGGDFVLPLADLLIMLWVFLLFFVLGTVHLLARQDDIKVYTKTEEYIATYIDKPEILGKAPDRGPVNPMLTQQTMSPFFALGVLLLLACSFGRVRK